MYDSKKNFRHNPDYIKEEFICDSCMTEVDENTHVMYCESYKELRANKDLSNSDRDLAEYLREILKLRTEHRLSR